MAHDLNLALQAIADRIEAWNDDAGQTDVGDPIYCIEDIGNILDDALHPEPWLVCHECGAADIDEPDWLNPNTGVINPSNQETAPNSHRWCNNCGGHGSWVEPAEFESERQAIDGAQDAHVRLTLDLVASGNLPGTLAEGQGAH